ncbi:battenin isoform X2 [Anguilla anguilla]|uniref:battenin isoform X2 n=1 Tax=Anguilla anguilla TaxID=7936 RepID=UPI0015A79281|nr:battenin isoform X2 [Anguilla anguilla]
MDHTETLSGDHVPIVTSNSRGRVSFWRNVSGFWLLGLCNNFAYVVMLSAAHDILKQQETHNTTTNTLSASLITPEGRNDSNSTRYDCNPVSTAAVLLADILPTLLIKLAAPFFIHKCPYGFRVLLCVAAAASSFLLVSFSSTVGMSILGVIFASVSSGLGELSFLSLTVFFDRTVLGGWGSGTGGAGVAGALLYSALTQVGLSPRATLLIMLVVPAIMAASYFFLLEFPPSFPQWRSRKGEGLLRDPSAQERRPLMTEVPDDAEREQEEEEGSASGDPGDAGDLTCAERLVALRGLLKFIIPLSVVYFAEYFINQGLLELLFFPGYYMSHAEQYRWYQTLYQIGVFFSRSSLFCMKLRRVWVLSVLQCVNAGLLTVAVYYQFLPSAPVVFAIVVYEGLLGGAAYVNTFYFISKETGSREREFAMSAASVGDSFGIAVSGVTAIPLHNYFCSL